MTKLAVPKLKNKDLLKDRLLIGGKWLKARSSRTYQVRNPANGAVIAEVADAGGAETDKAIAAAAAAFPGYAALVAQQRTELLRAWYDLIIAHSEDLARLVTAEMGKPLAESRAEAVYGAGFVEWFAEEAKRAYGDVIPTHQPDKRIFAIRQPVGVCAAITPWNFPIAMITRKVAPALAAGCTVVVKPAGSTPLAALALGALAGKAGFPDGVLNVVTSSRAAEVGAALTASTTVRKLTFTGSTEVGRKLYAQCAQDIKKLSLELGGNAPFIVFADADLEAAVDGAMICKFRNTGQTCVCANRIYVQSEVHDKFAQMLTKAVRKLKVGDGMADGVNQGPLIDEAGLAKVREHVADAVGRGAHVLCGGRRHKLGGLFFQPTVLAGVTADMQINSEETFGPVAPLIRFDTEEEAVALANDSPFGLASYFYTKDLARAHRVAERIESGIVGINTGLISTPAAPFGGVKQSGLGREGSKYGINEFLEIKYLCMGGIS